MSVRKSYAICKLTIVPVRATHSDASEQVTQLLFGDVIQLIGSHQQWRKIRILHDNYEGWIDHKQLLPIREETALKLSKNKVFQQIERTNIITPWGKQEVLQGSLVLSSRKDFEIDGRHFHYENLPLTTAQNCIELAQKYLNAPYLWGGRTKYGIDCSGFTQSVMHQIGVQLHRDSSQQAMQGKAVDFSNKKVGDLAFFTSAEGEKVIHVGILLPHQEIIHAHGRVRIDRIDTNGILNRDQNYYSHKLHSIRKFV